MPIEREAVLPDDESQAAISLVRSLSGKLGTIGLDAHDAASHLTDVAKQFERQEMQLRQLRASAQAMVFLRRTKGMVRAAPISTA